MSPRMLVDYDPQVNPDGETLQDIDYADMDPDEVLLLAMEGDTDAGAFLNVDRPQEDEDATVNEKGEVLLPPIAVPGGLKPGDRVEVEWADDTKTVPVAPVNDVHVDVHVPEIKMPEIPRPNITVQPADVHVDFPKEKKRRTTARKLEDGSIEIITEPMEDDE